jgi:hypothetical protein
MMVACCGFSAVVRQPFADMGRAAPTQAAIIILAQMLGVRASHHTNSEKRFHATTQRRNEEPLYVAPLRRCVRLSLPLILVCSRKFVPE